MNNLAIFLILLMLGYGTGRYLENRHYRSILRQEEKFRQIPVIASKFPPDMEQPCKTRLVTGNVVISVDYFKRFLANLRNITGGRVTSYESLIDRARREAILRMKKHAKDHNAQYVFNVKMETSSVFKGSGNSVGSVEVLAYGTAIIPFDVDA